MAIPIPASESNFGPVPAGTYVARCYKMIHIGTIQEKIKGEDKIINKIIIHWELPTKKKEFKQGQGEKPYSVSQNYNVSMNENSNFRKMLESWESKSFTADMLKNFDVTSLLGKPGTVTVKHRIEGDKTYADVIAVTPVPEGSSVPPQINETFLLDYDNFTKEKFDSQPQWIQDKILRSLEYAALQNNNQAHYQQQNNDDLPY